MRFVKLLLFLLGWVSVTHLQAKSAEEGAPNAAKLVGLKKGLTVQVQGMVCAFCAQGLKKKFNAREEIASTEVDLDQMKIHLHLKPGKKLRIEVIEEIITEAGFKFVGIQ